MNTVFGYTIYVILIFLGVNIYVAQIGARSVGMCFNYWSYGTLVFPLRRLDVPRFIATYGLNYIFSVILLVAILRVTANKYLAGMLCIAITSVANLIALKYFVAVQEPQ